jgi:hypothetical protein
MPKMKGFDHNIVIQITNFDQEFPINLWMMEALSSTRLLPSLWLFEWAIWKSVAQTRQCFTGCHFFGWPNAWICYPFLVIRSWLNTEEKLQFDVPHCPSIRQVKEDCWNSVSQWNDNYNQSHFQEMFQF